MKTPIRIEDDCFLVAADHELICKTESATYDELQQIVEAVNAYETLRKCAKALEALVQEIKFTPLGVSQILRVAEAELALSKLKEKHNDQA